MCFSQGKSPPSPLPTPNTQKSAWHITNASWISVEWSLSPNSWSCWHGEPRGQPHSGSANWKAEMFPTMTYAFSLLMCNLSGKFQGLPYCQATENSVFHYWKILIPQAKQYWGVIKCFSMAESKFLNCCILAMGPWQPNLVPHIPHLWIGNKDCTQTEWDLR